MKKRRNLGQIGMLVAHMHQSGQMNLFGGVDAVGLPPLVDCSIRADIIANSDGVGNGGAVAGEVCFTISLLSGKR